MRLWGGPVCPGTIGRGGGRNRTPGDARNRRVAVLQERCRDKGADHDDGPRARKASRTDPGPPHPRGCGMTRFAPRPGPKAAAESPMPLFGREWVRAPLQVGAVAPSSARLARAITDGLTAASGPVIELGPGTGVFTAALLDRGIPADRIAAVESSPDFAAALARRFPRVTVICDDAARLRRLSPFGPGGASVIICGLPLLSIPPAKVLRILSGCLAALRPDGELRVFTYGPRCPVSRAMRARLGLMAQRGAFVPLNLPPATVHVLRRAAPRADASVGRDAAQP